MAEYIKRTDLIDTVEELLKSPYANDNSENILLRQFSCGVRDALKFIRDIAADAVPDNMKIPSADVRENVRGSWMQRGDEIYAVWECSCCGYWRITERKPNYCENCGAEMKTREKGV